MSAKKREREAKWNRVRYEVIERDKRCVRCGYWGSHVHHILRRSQGGLDLPENLVLLCVGCHDWIHANPAEAFELGLLTHPEAS